MRSTHYIVKNFFIEFTDHANPKSKIIITNFYRPLHSAISQLTSFIEYFTQKISIVNLQEATLACGDFNINLLSLDSNHQSQIITVIHICKVPCVLDFFLL